MRDPKRIDEFCEELKKYWKMVPDWRFGQLIVNLYSAADKDIFFIEDEESLKIFEDMFNNIAESIVERTDKDIEELKKWNNILKKLP